MKLFAVLTVPEVYCIRVCPSVSECVDESVRPENLVNISKTNVENVAQCWSQIYLG